MDNIKYTSLPSEEEMRLFLELGRRLRIFDSVLIKDNQKILYENIIAVNCLICFVRWLFQDVNTKEKNDFLIKKDIWTNAELQNYVRFKSLDFLEEVAKKKNLPFSLSLAEIGRKYIKEHDYYPFVTIDPVIEEDSYYRNINDHDRISVFFNSS